MTNFMTNLSTFLSAYDATELSSILIAGLPTSDILLAFPLTTKDPIGLELSTVFSLKPLTQPSKNSNKLCPH